MGDAVAAAGLSGQPAIVMADAPDTRTEVTGLFSSRDSRDVQLFEGLVPLRPGGFSPDACSNSRIVQKGEARQTLIAGYRVLEVWSDGSVIFAGDGRRDFLSWGSKGANLRINQLALIES